MLYTGINLISLNWWKFKTNMPICPLGYHTTSQLLFNILDNDNFVNVFRQM